MDVRPIRTEADYEAVMAEIDRLMDAPDGSPDADRLEVLSTLVEAYEKDRYELPPPDAVAAILYYMESRGLSFSDVQPLIGNEEIAAQVLERRRALSLGMIRRLHDRLGIPADALIRPYKLARKVDLRGERDHSHRRAGH